MEFNRLTFERLLNAVLVLFLFRTVSGFGKLTADDIIIVNRPISVLFGRSVYIDPISDLKLHVQTGNSCSLTVLDNELDLTFKPGKISRSNFPCDFAAEEICYTHFGGKKKGQDVIKILLKYESVTETLIIPFNLIINVIYKPLEIIQHQNAVTVNRHLGLSTPLGPSTITFAQFDKNVVCKISAISPTSGLPQYGYLTNSSHSLTSVDCDNFLIIGIRYKHNAAARGPNRDFIPFTVELFDENGVLQHQEYFQIRVDILSGYENTPPEPSRTSLFVMDSNSLLVMTAITPDIVSAVDDHSPSDKLLFNITFPLGPNEGMIVNTDHPTIPIYSFYQHEINNLKIAYVPPNLDSYINRLYQFEFVIVDTEELASEPIPMMIVVNPVSAKAPVVTKNTGIQLIEGQSTPIISPDVLVISDMDNLKDVKVYHIDGLKHGHLQLPPGQNYFTANDLEEGSVVYHHDNSDSSSDNIVFQMSDGNSDVQFLFPVIVYPKDDQPPTLSVNTGLELRKNEIAEINQSILKATDIDTDDAYVVFSIVSPVSKIGEILKRQFLRPENVNNWNRQKEIYERTVNSFTLKDVLEGKICYRYVGDQISDVLTDKIHFRLSDEGSPPNFSPIYTLNVKVHPTDDKPPNLYPNTQLYIEVEDNEMVAFKRRSFKFTDEDSSDRDILFIVTSQPYDTYPDGALDAGTIVHCDDHRQIMTHFQQSEINHQKICYSPPSAELRLTTRIVMFDFNVEDTTGNVLPDQRYTILLKPVNNEPPAIKNSGATVDENSVIRITKDMLSVEDKDTDIKHIIMKVMTVPKYGILYKENDILAGGSKFKQDDIDRGKIMYRNSGDDNEMSEDTIDLDVSDGIHHIPVTFRIKIKQIDDEFMYLDGSPRSGTLNINLDVMEKKSVTLRPELFTLRDPDSDILSVTYVVRKHPEFGVIYKNGVRVNYFSQRDVWLGQVAYEHDKREIGMNNVIDEVTLAAYDNDRILLPDGTKLVDIQIHVTVLAVNDFTPVVRLGPNLDVLEGRTALILSSHIDIQDEDTRVDDILCIITEQPSHGFISDDSPRFGMDRSVEMLPISAFSVEKLQEGKILYIQSVHRGVEPRHEQFVFHCSDGRNLSHKKKLDIDIHPTNDEIPEVFVKEFIGTEGMEIRIDSSVLKAVDGDKPPETLHFVITKQPRNGQILQETPAGDVAVNNFTLEDIKTFSTVKYEHDDSETQSDSFEFTLSDGKHSISKSVPIKIFPVDDEAPRLVVNNGIEIENLGDHKVITNKNLKAEDLDSADGNITYVIKVFPQQGYLVKHFGDRWNHRNLTFGSNFTQTDIDKEIISYIHTGTDAKRDFLKFDVTDGLNSLLDRYFFITIKGVNIIYPEVVNKGLLLPKNGIVTLTTDVIEPGDSDTLDEDLTFSVTKTPHHGYLESVDRPGHPVTSFTRLDLTAAKLRYVHNSEYEIKIDNFEFEMTDESNPVHRTYRIALVDVDNKNPVVMHSVLRLEEGTNQIINQSHLSAIDLDTPDENIIFTITQVPLHGNLLYNFSRIVSRFTLKDIKEKFISYQHDGTETMSDSFIFTVADGTHSQFYIPGSDLPTRKPQEMDIEIIPDDDGKPHVSVNIAARTLTTTDEGLGFTLTNENLQGEDQDSKNEELHYTITVQPQHGYLRHAEHGKDRIFSWVQEDVNQQRIQYVLNPGENATEDCFFFRLSDPGGNVLENQPFHLHWSWVSFRQSQVTVNETDEVLEVILLRRGDLSVTSFVSINVTEKTAGIGKDVSRQYAEQVQFNPGQMEKSWHLSIRDDDVYEMDETLIVHMEHPVSTVLQHPHVVMVTIVDPEDESTVYFPEKLFNIEENIGELEVPVYRTGDLSKEMAVICFTIEGTARGTSPNQLQSYSDYFSRPENHNSIVRFNRGENQKTCTVTIIDDTLYEEVEKFSLFLGQPIGGRVATSDRETVVVIGPDPNDEPKFYFDQRQYQVDESAGTLQVKVWKTGSDLSRPSSVTVKSRQTDPVSAKATVDYVPVVRILDFAPGEMTKVLDVTILDDVGHPVLEGLENFLLHLRMPVGGTLGEPSFTVVTINDSLSDLPKMEFASAIYEVMENENEAVAMVTRSGDLSHESHVRCYTQQATALMDDDYIERPNTNTSFITFKPYEKEAECSVKLINDRLHEVEESFRLVLSMPDSSMPGGATLGGQITTKIVIKDPEDSPVIRFEKNHYTVNEPIIKGDINVLHIPVIRMGDTTAMSEIRVSVRSGTATVARDFNLRTTLLRFSPGVERLQVEIEINYDNKSENTESFTVQLSKDLQRIAQVPDYNSHVTVYIEENSQLADVTFPIQPLIVSLRDYDHAEQAMNIRPINGYPLICISPCNHRHPKYEDVRQICEDSGIDDSQTKFRWRVGSPRDQNGVYGFIRDLETDTVFTKARFITLDSFYFTRGSQVQCYARAVNMAGEPGQEVGSSIITVDDKGLCPPRASGGNEAASFSAKLRYTGSDDLHHPNPLKLSLRLPHSDNMLPFLSSRRLSNISVSLQADVMRQEHQCSNLLDFDEISTKYGFITNGTERQTEHVVAMETYQFDDTLRPQATLRFYKNLDLESCMWTFEAFYDISELVRSCRGTVAADTRIMNIKQSHVSVKVPLYVSYVYYPTHHSNVWRNVEQNTELRLRFVYNTDRLWKDGISADGVKDLDLKARLHPVSIRVTEDNRLVVSFKTVANFRGQFIHSSRKKNLFSAITSMNDPSLSFKLRLIHSDPTFDQPEQLWEMVAMETSLDFSGDYKILLLPCFVTLTQKYSLKPVCSYGNPMTFDLPIKLQQIDDPVPEKYSLNAELYLVRRKELWLTDSLQGLDLKEDNTIFVPGDTIYGRVSVDPVQLLGKRYVLKIDKVYLCSGKDGYIPRYDPDNGEHGCTGRLHNLDTVLKIIDTESPYTVATNYHGLPLNVVLAHDDMPDTDLVNHPEIDGFSLDSKPLFQVNDGKQWFIHTIYAILSGNNMNDQHVRSIQSVTVKALTNLSSKGNVEFGTNMVPLLLDFDGKSVDDKILKSDEVTKNDQGQTLLLVVLISSGILLLIGIFVLVIFIRHRRKHTSPPPTPSGTITVMSTSPGQTRVISNAHIFKPNNHTEI